MDTDNLKKRAEAILGLPEAFGRKAQAFLAANARTIGRALLALLAALVLIFVVNYVTRPARVVVERTVRIHAPASAVFSLIDDFHGWARWSPWDMRDPEMERTFGGPAAGKGSTYSWVSRRSGDASLTITDSVENQRVLILYKLLEPFQADIDNAFVLTPAGDETNVAWTVSLDNTPTMKAMSLFKKMEDVLEPEIDAGLANLKATLENPPGERAPAAGSAAPLAAASAAPEGAAPAPTAPAASATP